MLTFGITFLMKKNKIEVLNGFGSFKDANHVVITKEFQNFGEPIAAASIAQVHFAEIKDGEKIIPVAVKILRPNIIETIEDEMYRLDWLTNFLENFSGD